MRFLWRGDQLFMSPLRSNGILVVESEVISVHHQLISPTQMAFAMYFVSTTDSNLRPRELWQLLKNAHN